MAEKKHLINEERRIVMYIKMKNKGNTYREIATFFNKTPAAMFKIVAAYKNDGRVSVAPKSGRPKVTNVRTDKRIVNISSSDPFLSAPKIRSKLLSENKNAPSTQTIRRRLHASGKHGRVARKLPYVNKKNLKNRMDFYNKHVLKPLKFWKNILWTDESMIRLKYSHGRMYVWRRQEQFSSYQCAKST